MLGRPDSSSNHYSRTGVAVQMIAMLAPLRHELR